MEDFFLVLIEYYNVKFYVFYIYFNPLMFCEEFLVASTVFIIFNLIILFIISLLFLLRWFKIYCIFECDYMSYGLIFLRSWICVLIIMARESINQANYFRLALPTSQLNLQPSRCFTYVTAHSPSLVSLLLRHRFFTYVTWRAAHAPYQDIL